MEIGTVLSMAERPVAEALAVQIQNRGQSQFGTDSCRPPGLEGETRIETNLVMPAAQSDLRC